MRTHTSKIFVLVALIVMSSSCVDTKMPSYTAESEGRLLLGATVHLGNGEVIENAALIIKDGYVTRLERNASEKFDLSKFQVELLSSEYHIYPFKKTKLGNSGIVLPRADAKPFNITISDSEAEKGVAIGAEAALLICKGSITDISKFKVEYVVDGRDKIKILEQSDYKAKGNNNR
ncbi:hypothetical protein [Roseivirga echinicomitans]|nr:hypothetical protein [Roseivirga echinicomitans]